MRRPVLFTIAALAGVSACGASIQAVYEGDVRFERCMALDSRSDVKPTLRSACWEEWVKYYTFGQTLDRVEYAKQREKQLRTASDFEEGLALSLAGEARARSAVPDPTSVLAPPPMTLATDGGVPGASTDTGGDDAGADASIPAPPGAACADECDEAWTTCRKECAITACNKGCEAKHRRCMRRCF